MQAAIPAEVLRVDDVGLDAIRAIAARYDIGLEWLEPEAAIEYSFWGEPEAGISRDGVQFRSDTPLHSLLHELSHIVCMTAARRTSLERHAGGSVAEECAVCYLQVLLASHIAGYSAERCLIDMDLWGYSFREGAAGAWFAGDGRDARQWLTRYGLIDAAGNPTWRMRS